MTRVERFVDRVAVGVLIVIGGFLTLVGIGLMTGGVPQYFPWGELAAVCGVSTVAWLWLITHKQG